MVARIEQLRRNHKHSVRRIACELAAEDVRVSARTVTRVLDRLGLNRRTDIRPGYVFLHSVVDGHSRLAYAEHLPDERASTTIGFFHRARAFFAAHGIVRLTRIVTDNGSNYRADAFHAVVQAHAARHQRTRPYTPRHNGKVERYNRILAEEFFYNYHRPPTSAGNQPPAAELLTGVTNVIASYTEPAPAPRALGRSLLRARRQSFRWTALRATSFAASSETRLAVSRTAVWTGASTRLAGGGERVVDLRVRPRGALGD